jgi:hypothetical protein
LTKGQSSKDAPEVFAAIRKLIPLTISMQPIAAQRAPEKNNAVRFRICMLPPENKVFYLSVQI